MDLISCDLPTDRPTIMCMRWNGAVEYILFYSRVFVHLSEWCGRRIFIYGLNNCKLFPISLTSEKLNYYWKNFRNEAHSLSLASYGRWSRTERTMFQNRCESTWCDDVMIGTLWGAINQRSSTNRTTVNIGAGRGLVNRRSFNNLPQRRHG